MQLDYVLTFPSQGGHDPICADNKKPPWRSSLDQGTFSAENAVGVVEANLAIDEEFEQVGR